MAPAHFTVHFAILPTNGVCGSVHSACARPPCQTNHCVFPLRYSRALSRCIFASLVFVSFARVRSPMLPTGLSLADMIQYYPSVIHVGSQLVRASKVLDIPVITTEQYPKALGKTGTGPASHASTREQPRYFFFKL